MIRRAAFAVCLTALLAFVALTAFTVIDDLRTPPPDFLGIIQSAEWRERYEELGNKRNPTLAEIEEFRAIKARLESQ